MILQGGNIKTKYKNKKKEAVMEEAPTAVAAIPDVNKTVGDLKPAPYNPRKITDDKLRMLRKAMIEFGDLSGIVFNVRTGRVVGGHQRIKHLDPTWEIRKESGAEDSVGTVANGWIETPFGRWTYREVDWPEQKEVAANIAANKQGGEFDIPLLKDLLVQIDDGAADMELTGFDTSELEEMMTEEGGGKDKAKIVLSAEDNATLDEAWKEWARDMVAGMGALEALGFLSLGASPAVAKVRFLNSLYYGDNFPRWVTFAYQPHRMKVPGAQNSIYEMLEKNTVDTAYSKNFRFALCDDPNFDRLLATGAPIAGGRQPQDFPVPLAKELINEFCPEEGAVLDPCHGWGGRLIGFLLSKAGRYVGFDPSPETADGLKRMAADLNPYVPDKIVDTYAIPFEDSTLEDETFDLALTSPPYYDLERYTGDDSSFRRYGNFKAWDEGFYSQMINKTHAALKAGGVFALQVGNQKYPMERLAKEHAERAGYIYIGTRSAGMQNNLRETEEERGEVVVLFRKA
jgi:hypothetical protein